MVSCKGKLTIQYVSIQLLLKYMCCIFTSPFLPPPLVDPTRGPEQWNRMVHPTCSPDQWSLKNKELFRIELMNRPRKGGVDLKTRSCSGLDQWIIRAWEVFNSVIPCLVFFVVDIMLISSLSQTKYIFATASCYWSYYQLWFREFMSTVCGIFLNLN